MNKTEQMPDKQYMFGALLMIANKMDTLLERDLKEFGVTSKQWFLSIVVDSLFESSPTLKEVAKEMGSSHQNIKQVALKLQEKSLLQLVKDKKDKRVTRIIMTQESNEFWKKTQPKGEQFSNALFADINEEDITSAARVLRKIMENLYIMENENEEGEAEE